MPLRSRSAFTLIELLVVIAIIAILASILFPVFGRARENARRASCASNIKQIALGFMQYCQDYDERLPPIYVNLDGTAGVSSPLDLGWAQLLQPYLKSVQIFQCPSEPQSSDITGGFTTGYSDYWYNGRLGTTDPMTYYAITPGGRSQAAIEFPTTTILTGEGNSELAAFNCYSESIPNPDLSNALLPPAAQRHLNGANYSFLDGHVKWVYAESDTTSSKIWDDDLSGSTTPAKGSVISFSP